MTKPFSSMIWDYLVFAIFLVSSTIYPLWGETIGRKTKKTKENYVFATGRVSIFAMMLSIARGTLGVRAFLGYPSELFYRGSGMWETIYGLVTAYPIVSMIFVPVYCKLGITSVYQYLDLRFKSRLVRCLASASFILRNILTLGITVYTPCVALNTVVGVPYWASLITMTAISILFTILGGLKAAITADVIQGLTMILVSLGVIIQGAYETGGVDKMYNINKDNDRLQFFQVGDLSTRVDTVSAWVGQLFISLSVLGCQQNLVQRYLSMKDVKEVRRTLMANIPFIVVLFSLAWVVGMGVYSTYFNCDPMEAGYIKKMDEILPFFVEDKLSYIPGFLGIFMATLFNGALCLNVSNLNSLATVTWEDFLLPLPRFNKMVDKQQLHIIKFLGVIYAIIILGVAFSVGLLSGVIESAMLTSSATSGPLVGVFLLAMLVPIANWKGASAGMICAHIIIITISFGSFTIEKPPEKLLPISIDGCSNDTFSPWISKSETSWLIQNSPVEIAWNNNDSFPLLKHEYSKLPERTFIQTIFSITYMYYSLLGTFITMFVGILISWMTKSEEDYKYDKNLIHSWIWRMNNFFSKKDNLINSNSNSNRKDSHLVILNENGSSSTNSNNDSEHINYGFDSISIDKEQNKNQNVNFSNEFENIELPSTSSAQNIQSISSSTINGKNFYTTSILEPTEFYRKINDADK